MVKTIKIKEKTHKKLEKFKFRYHYKSYDKAIEGLLEAQGGLLLA